MSESSPADLAVAFSALPRRINEARGTSITTTEIAGVVAEINSLVESAARLMHTKAEPTAVADAIEHVHADDWDEADLESLRHTALDIGRLVRHLATLAETDDD